MIISPVTAQLSDAGSSTQTTPLIAADQQSQPTAGPSSDARTDNRWINVPAFRKVKPEEDDEEEAKAEALMRKYMGKPVTNVKRRRIPNKGQMVCALLLHICIILYV